MPTILELFKGSSKDISPKVLDKTPLSVDDTKQIDKKGLYFDANVYTSGTNYSLVKSKKPPKNKTFNTVSNFVEQEIWGIRVKSAVELNNPLIYGNQAIRIATRSTSSVEKMKAATGGEGTDGGLIGKGLGAITGGKFGKFVFGGKVTSLNQARDGINGRLGIPQNTIPTYVNNTGELQKGIEPNTMITIAKIKNDAAGTELGKFLKQTGGGKPKTIATQALGQGISLVKDKLREKLFGNPASMGSNTAQPANGGYEYSSENPYSQQIKDVKSEEPSTDKLAIPPTDEIKNKTLSKLNEKKPLGAIATDTTTTPDSKYSALNSTSVVNNSTDTKLSALSPQDTNQIKQDTRNQLDKNKKLGEKTEDTSTTSDEKYSQSLGNYKNETQDGKFTRIDLSLVSPVYGVDRKSTKGKYGKETSEYAFQDVNNTTGIFSPYNPTEGNNYTSKNKQNWKNLYGLDNGYDEVSLSEVKKRGDAELDAIEKTDLIPFWIKSQRSERTVHFRSYISGISETVSPSWQSSKFFGNPFNFYTYDGVERNVQFTLKVVCLNSNELASNWEKLEFLTQQAYPTFNKLNKGTYTIPPIISFRLGNIYKDKIGYIESLSHTIPDNSTWETDIDGLLLPKFIDISITIKFIEQEGDESVIYKYKRTKDTIQLINEKNSAQGGSFTTDSVSTSEKPAKVDEYGVESKTTNEGGVNKTPTSLNDGSNQPTPKEKESGEIVGVKGYTTSEKVSSAEEAQQKIEAKGVPTEAAKTMAWVDGVVLDSIQKLNETDYYFEQKGTYHQNTGTTLEHTRNRVCIYDKGRYKPISYQNWVTNYNGGVDKLNKL